MGTLQDTRLELLKLTHTLGRNAAEAVARARELEEYVLAAPLPSPTVPLSRKREPRVVAISDTSSNEPEI